MNLKYLSPNQRIKNCLLFQSVCAKFIGSFRDFRRRGFAGEVKRINAGSDKGEIFVGRKLSQIPLIPLAVVI